MKRKYCKAYFVIKGKSNHDKIIEEIGVLPDKTIVNDDYFELHYGYTEKYDDISWENISDVLYLVIKQLIEKDSLLASLKTKYNLKFDLPIDTNALDLSEVLVLDGKVTTFLHWSNTREDLSWYYF